MHNEQKSKLSFEKFSASVAKVTGSSMAFIIALLLVIVWVICGPFFHYSDSWQLVINTSTTIITFLMVFVIQQAQNKDTLAVQIKLNELIAATKGASNKALNIEDLTEDELKVLKKFYSRLSDMAEKEGKLGAAHSLDEAEKNATLQEIANNPQ